MGKTLLFSACAAALAVVAGPAQAVELIQNGDFNAGLTGWTSYTTANGTISPSNPNQGGVPFHDQFAEIASFNVTGAGASNALWINAGQYLPPYGAAYEGGGVFQSFTSVAGEVSFSADIAAMTIQAGAPGGIFSVLIDDVVLASYDLGAITGTARQSLDFTTDLAAGDHTLKLQIVRPYGPSVGRHAQYFDNISLDLTPAVPEPATWAMMIGGFAIAGASLRRRKVSASFA